MSFCQRLPKVELHAHLNGSLDNNTLVALSRLKHGDSGSRIDKDLYQVLESNTNDLTSCFQKFKYAHDLTDTAAALALATKMVIANFANDNVIYLELRTTPRQTDHLTKCEYLSVICKTIGDCKSSHPQILVKLLPSIDRSKGLAEAEENVEIILNLQKIHSTIIKGVDFSGNPEIGCFRDFKQLFERVRNSGLRIALHCGEVDNEREVMEMLDFGMDRLGHGTFIKGKALTTLLGKSIPVECCLTSNVFCKTVASYEDHHFAKLFKSNHPIVVSTDDLGVFNTTLSKELRICQKTFQLTTFDLFTLTKSAIDHSFASAREKDALHDELTNFIKL